MTSSISIESYLNIQGEVPLLDIRTPLEFESGHIPTAINLPIFTNEERVLIGTKYKKVSREAAILLGFDFVGPKFRGFIEQALKIAPNKKVVVHCWRGGMRSSAMAWALDFYGFEVSIIQGGYKSYRNWVLQQFERTYQMMILGGMTGCHKTEILHALKQQGHQMVDLEELANHQGSAYGSMNSKIQPTQEQFENQLATVLSHINTDQLLWVEDESSAIGSIGIPHTFRKQMREAPMIELRLDINQRIDFLEQEYGVLDKQFLIEATEHIRKRLGNELTEEAIAAIQNNEIRTFIRIVLFYYDRVYQKAQLKKETTAIHQLPLNYTTAENAANDLIQFFNTLKQ